MGIPWPTIPLAEACDRLIDGDWIETKDQGGDGYRLVQVSNIGLGNFQETGNFRWVTQETFDRLRCTAINIGDILIARMPDPTGRAWYVSNLPWPAVTAVDVAIATPNLDVVDGRFLAYQLNSPAQLSVVAVQATGTTRLRITRRVLAEMQVPVPPLPVQRKIAAILAAYDELIENNLRRIEILEEIAAAVYHEWFVARGSPVHPSNAEADRSVSGNWRRDRLDHVVRVFRGRSYSTSNLVDAGGHAFLNLKCIDRDGGFRRHGLKRYDGPFQANQLARTGDILVAVTDMTQERRIVARAARVPRLPEPESVFSADLVRLVPLDPADGPFVYASLRFSEFPERVKQFANGANVLHLNPARIAEYEMPMPPSEQRRSFGELLTPLLELSDTLELQIETLRGTRDLLLPRLVSGEVDVSALDIDLEWLAS